MGNLTGVQIGPKTRALDRFRNHQQTQLPHTESLQTRTTPKTPLFGLILYSAEPYLRELKTLPPIKYWGYDRITI
jgi:hypothetical protein